MAGLRVAVGSPDYGGRRLVHGGTQARYHSAPAPQSRRILSRPAADRCGHALAARTLWEPGALDRVRRVPCPDDGRGAVTRPRVAVDARVPGVRARVAQEAARRLSRTP